MYRVREVDGAEYADELAELHAETFTAGEGKPDFTDGYWWIAFYEDAPVAFIGIKQSKLGAHVGYFHRVGVLPAHRGNQLQRRLMRAMETKAKGVGWLRIVTDTRQNAASTNNIIAAAYRYFIPDDPWGHHDACYWTKELTRYDRQQSRRAPRRNHSTTRRSRREQGGRRAARTRSKDGQERRR